MTPGAPGRADRLGRQTRRRPTERRKLSGRAPLKLPADADPAPSTTTTPHLNCSWHPSGCNICGQLGHQAAQCTTGTVNWQALYGDNVFAIAPTVYQSDLDAAKKARQVDFEELELRAKDYAKASRATGWLPARRPPPCMICGLPSAVCGSRAAAQLHSPAAAITALAVLQMVAEGGGPPPSQQAAQQHLQQQQQQQQQGGAPAVAPAAPVDEEAEARKREAAADLPEGWAVALDAQKKPYFWHKATKKVQWDKPTASDTPAAAS